MVNEDGDLKNLLGKLRQEHNTAWSYGILESSQDPILIIDQDWRVCFENSAAQRLLDSPEETNGGIFLRPIRPAIPLEKARVECYPIECEGCIELQYTQSEWQNQPAFMVRLRPVEMGDEEDDFGLSVLLANTWHYWTDLDGNIRFASPNVQNLTGYTGQDFETQPDLLFESIHPDDRGIFLQHLEADLEGEAGTPLILRWITRSGETRWVRHISQPAYDENGQWIGRNESMQDITEFKQHSDESRRVQNILDMVGVAGQSLLTARWRELVPDLLGRLGEAAEIDRVSLYTNVEREGSVVQRRQYGWQAADLIPEQNVPSYKTGPLSNLGLVGWEEPLSQNHSMQTHVSKLSARDNTVLSLLNIKSILAVPIFAGPDWWGVVEMDVARTERVWQSNEMEAIKAFTNILGSAIQRERTEEDIRSLVEAERRKAEAAWALRETSLTLNSVLDVEVVLDRLLTLVHQILPMDTGCIYLLENRTLVPVRFIDHYNDSHVVREPSLKQWDLDELPLFKQMAETLAPKLVSSTEESPDWINPENKPMVLSWIGAPILAENKPIGFFSLGCRRVNGFMQEHVTPLVAFANQAARALQNSRLFDDVANTLVHEQRLNEIAQIISSSLDLSTVLQTILQLTSQLVSADLSALALASDDRNELQMTYSYMVSIDKVGRALHRGVGVSWRVFETMSTVVLSEYTSHFQALPEWKALGVHAYLGVPLISGKECLGVLNLFKVAPNREFKDRDRFLAEMVARQAGVAIQNSRRYEEAQRLATRDSLTSLYNRRHLFELAAREFDRSRRYNRPMAAIMLDLDNLKKINDTFGHQAGDQALQTVAKICISTLRRPDLIGRYGGDEFIMVLPETTLTSASNVAERLRNNVSKYPMTNEGAQVKLSVSLGVAGLVPETRSLETLIDHADQAQYQAKQSGKDKVCTWGENKKAEPDKS